MKKVANNNNAHFKKKKKKRMFFNYGFGFSDIPKSSRQALTSTQHCTIFFGLNRDAKQTMMLLSSPPIISHFPPNNPIRFRVSTIIKSLSSKAAIDGRTSYAGVRLEEKVEVIDAVKIRLDAWISSKIEGISRARVQSSIRSGLVSVNGRVVDKVLIYFFFLPLF